jgi:hypothetical protein
MSVNKEKPALNGGRSVGHLLSHVVLAKIGTALRANDAPSLQAAKDFKRLLEGEWNYRVNSAAVKQINAEKRNKIPVIPLTEDLQTFRAHILQRIKELSIAVRQSKHAADWTELAKFTMARLISFNKRRRAEVKDLKVQGNSTWHYLLSIKSWPTGRVASI